MAVFSNLVTAVTSSREKSDDCWSISAGRRELSRHGVFQCENIVVLQQHRIVTKNTRRKQVIKVTRHKAASTQCTDRSFVFARWRQRISHLRHGSLAHISLAPNGTLTGSAVFVVLAVVSNTQTDYRTEQDRDGVWT